MADPDQADWLQLKTLTIHSSSGAEEQQVQQGQRVQRNPRIQVRTLKRAAARMENRKQTVRCRKEKGKKKMTQGRGIRLKTERTHHPLPVRVAGHRCRQQQQQWPVEPQLPRPPIRPGQSTSPLCRHRGPGQDALPRGHHHGC